MEFTTLVFNVLESIILMKKSPLRKLSGKRRKEVNLYLKARKKYLEDHMTCEICNELESTQIHHSAGRQKERLLKQEWWVAVCQSCHSFVHANPEASLKSGWLLHRTDNL